MKKKILFVIVVIICCAAAWGWYLYKKPRTGVTGMASAVTIEAPALYYQYQQNEVVADSLYSGKVLTVKGVIDEVQQTDSTVSISLHGSDMAGINCSMTATEKNTIKTVKGAFVTVKGRCTGFLMDVNLVDCIIE